MSPKEEGLIDVVSVDTGEMRRRRGFVYVGRFNDGYGTLGRVKKDSYEWYRQVIESNGAVLKKYDLCIISVLQTWRVTPCWCDFTGGRG